MTSSLSSAVLDNSIHWMGTTSDQSDHPKIWLHCNWLCTVCVGMIFVWAWFFIWVGLCSNGGGYEWHCNHRKLPVLAGECCQFHRGNNSGYEKYSVTAVVTVSLPIAHPARGIKKMKMLEKLEFERTNPFWMHCPLPHWYWRQSCSSFLGQSSSSLMSRQSVSPSHTQLEGIHWPSETGSYHKREKNAVQ